MLQEPECSSGRNSTKRNLWKCDENSVLSHEQKKKSKTRQKQTEIVAGGVFKGNKREADRQET